MKKTLCVYLVAISICISLVLVACGKTPTYVKNDYVNRVATIDLGSDDATLRTQRNVGAAKLTTSTYLRDGNYLYFGTYPQTEVTDAATTAVLSTAAGTRPTYQNARNWTSYGYYINGAASNYMWYIDLTYSGEKYRGVYFTSYRPFNTALSGSADNSNVDDNGYSHSTVYWFKYEPIKWRILSETSGEALIFCEMAIDSQNFYIVADRSERKIIHENEVEEIIYENNYLYSTIRTWLNETFYNTAFSAAEKTSIVSTTVNNSARSTNPDDNATQWNSGTNDYACDDTEDYVFLLSTREVTTDNNGGAYWFDIKRDAIGIFSECKQNTDYAKCQGAYTIADGTYEGNGPWWLRSPMYDFSNDARFVNFDGYVDGSGSVDYTSGGIVPALKIRLS